MSAGLTFSNCSSWTSWQYRYTQILESKPYIDTYYHIGHRLQLKCFLFAQVLLNAHWAAINDDRPQKVRYEHLKFRTDLRDELLSVTRWMTVFGSRLLKKSFNRKSKLIQSECQRLSASVADSEMPAPCVYARPPERGPQELSYWICSQNLQSSSVRAFGTDHQIARWPAAAQTWTRIMTQTWTLQPDQRLVNNSYNTKVLSAPKSLHKLGRIWNLLSLLKMPKLLQADLKQWGLSNPRLQDWCNDCIFSLYHFHIFLYTPQP